ncbi:CGNR zinc finger domain-containing protein [Nocardiopsis aegyptia]|uniref:CGNR zinc finger domain-containing protein n=1 Tax=Nocardiopsis aegyptia TaxID=220378 RepID=UPI00367150F4
MTRTMRLADLPPAPGEETHASLALANSGGWGAGAEAVDLLGDPRRTTDWMVARGLAAPDADVQEYCSNRLRDFRGSVREVFDAAATHERPPASAIDAVNAAMKLAPAVECLVWSEPEGFLSVPAHPATQAVEYAMSAVAADVLALLTGEDTAVLARCAAPSCGRFLLRTHARRHWCSTRCGDRVRAARAYARRAGRE